MTDEEPQGAMAETRGGRITARLNAVFAPEMLAVRDVSRRHHGHAAWQGDDAETHFEVDIKAESLGDCPRLEAHRRINEALAEEFKTSENGTALHALQIRLL